MSAADRVGRALELAEQRRELGAFWALDRSGAISAASELDERRASGVSSGHLAATPVAVKDLFDQAGLPTTGGLPGPHSVADSDAEAVRRLRRAGAIPIGKTAMDPLGCTTGGQAPGFPPCLNPIDPALSPGGSSSGSAVAVATGIVPLGLGSDTAGSSRIPAAYCGVVAMKPAVGSIPGDGCIEVIPGVETPALLADSVGTCVRAYTALTGADPPAPSRRGPIRIGLLADLLERADDAVAEACRQALARLAGSELPVEEATLDWRPEGFGIVLAHQLAETWGERVDTEPSRFTELIRDTVEFGRTAGPDRYREALAKLAAGRDWARRRFERFDAVACPTVPIPAPAREAESVRVSTSFTRIFNALDWPAISVPVGGPPGVAPIAIQIAGSPSRLGAIFEVARRIERVAGNGPA